MPNSPITDEELVMDARAFAQDVMKVVGLNKEQFINGLDDGAYLAWTLTAAVEFSRLMLVSFLSCGANHTAWDHYFVHLANDAFAHLRPELKAEAIRQAALLSAKFNQPQEGVVH